MSSMIKKFIFKEKQGENKFTHLEISDEQKEQKKITFMVDGKNPFLIDFDSVRDLVKVLQELVGSVHQPLQGVNIRGIAQDVRLPLDVPSPEKQEKTPQEVLNDFLKRG